MIKQLLVIVLLSLLFVTINTDVHAVSSASPSATPTTTKKELNQVEDLKERLATKVAQLRQFDKRAFFGTVKSSSVASLVIATDTKDIKIELADELKIVQYIKGKRTVLTVDSIDNGDTVSIFGDYDTTLDVLKAKLLVIQNQIPVRIVGIVTENDPKEFTVTLEAVKGTSYIIDYETSTKTLEWSQSNAYQKSGFSKITKGSFITVLGYPVPKKDNRISATRIVVINTVSPAQTPTPKPKEATPSISPGANKTTPTPISVKTTNSPTAKTTPTIKPTIKITPATTP